jgi:hypothetical protein
MNWATSVDQLWRSETFAVWLTLAAAGFFAIVVFVALLRAEKSIANGALAVITLLAMGMAVATTSRGLGPAGQGASSETQPAQPTIAALPALSCIDDLAGETVLSACEKALFGSAESAAAAVSYAASQITRLTALGDAAPAKGSMTSELQTLRRAVERDRYGLMAQVLLVRDRCTPSECAAFRALTDRHQIVANMDERVYDGLISRYAPSWNAPAAAAAAGPVAALPQSMPTGKPTNAEFPTAASTPAVSIMTPEPATPAAPRAQAASSPPASLPAASSSPAAAAPLPSPRPASTPPTPAAAKKQPAPKPARTAAPPVQLAPTPPAPATAPVQAAAPAPSAANE